MKTPAFIIALCLFVVTHGRSQNIQERLAGFRTVAVEYSPDIYSWNFFESDSGRIYYSENRDRFENPYTSYLITPFDTLISFFYLSNYEYREWMESNPLFAFRSWFQSYDPHTAIAIAYDSMVIYHETDSGFIPDYTCVQYFNDDLPVSYTLTYAGKENPWDEYEFIYNADHQLIHTTIPYYDAEGIYHLYETEDYTYEEGRLIRSTETDYYYDVGPDIREYTYDDEGRYLTVLVLDDSIPKIRRELEYTGNLLTGMYTYLADGVDWDEYSHKSLTYDAEGRLSLVVDNVDLKYGGEIRYHYNANGQYDSITQYEMDGPTPELRSIETFDYDEKGRQTFYSYDDDIYHDGNNEFYVDHDYNEKGQLSDINYYVYEYDYDDNYVYYPKRYRYTYTESGNLLSRSSEYMFRINDEDEVYDGYDDTQNPQPWYITYFYYEPEIETGDQTIYVHAYPNPTTDQLNILIGNVVGSTQVITEISNIMGQLMLHEENVMETNFTKTIDCSSYAPGIYFITVSDGASRSSLKVMIR